MYRDLKKIKLDYATLQAQYEKVSKKCETLEKTMNSFKKQFRIQSEENI